MKFLRGLASQVEVVHAIVLRETRTRFGAQHPGCRGGAVLAEAVAGHEVGLETGVARQVGDRQREREQRRLGDVGAGERLHRPLEGVLAHGQAGGLVGLLHVAVEEVRVGLAQLGAHADLLRALPRIEKCELRHGATL